jgi:hypothetical protein
VDLIAAGGNYGWPDNEGTLPAGPPIGGALDPIFEYARSEGTTVVGGFIYRGTLFPQLAGKYIFGEFGRQIAGIQKVSTARMFAGDTATGTIEEIQIAPLGEQLADANDMGALISRQFILSIGADAAGELYLVVGDDPQFPRAVNPDGRIVRITNVVPAPTSIVVGAGLLGLLAWMRMRVGSSSSTKP